MKWTTKYVKLILKDIDDPWYIPEKNERYGVGNVWYIVKEHKPGRWEEIFSNIDDHSSPEPLDIVGGCRPNLDCFDYEEITEAEAVLELV